MWNVSSYRVTHIMDMCQRQGSQRGVVHGTAVFIQDALLTSFRVAEKTIGGRSSPKGQGSRVLVPRNVKYYLGT